MRIRVAGQSTRGIGRGKNDDHYCIGQVVEQSALTTLDLDDRSEDFQHYGLLVAVADGMGGYAGGEIASRVALETFRTRFYDERHDGYSAADWLATLQQSVEETQRTLLDVLQRSAELSEAGCTLAGVVLAPPDLLIVFHLGDSRVLRYSAGYVRQLTIDHTPVGADIASGRLTEEEAGRIPGNNALIRSLGMHGTSQADWLCEHSVLPGNAVFVGTDGWCGLGRGLSRRDVQEIARRENDPVVEIQQMTDGAVAAGSRDDTTIVAIHLAEDEGTHGR